MQREQYSDAAAALRRGELAAVNLTPAERKLLEFVETVTRHAYQVTDEQVQELRNVGWTDEQIAEAVYDAALFNLFVRLADAFGIEPPAEYEPEGIRAQSQEPSTPGAAFRPERLPRRLRLEPDAE